MLLRERVSSEAMGERAVAMPGRRPLRLARKQHT